MKIHQHTDIKHIRNFGLVNCNCVTMQTKTNSKIIKSGIINEDTNLKIIEALLYILHETGY